MGIAVTVSPDEIVAYEGVRQRLRALAVQYPWILEVPIAEAARKCAICQQPTLTESPPDTFTCRTCAIRYTQAMVVSRRYLATERQRWRERRP